MIGTKPMRLSDACAEAILAECPNCHRVLRIPYREYLGNSSGLYRADWYSLWVWKHCDPCY
jgi:hypothetical protein